MGDEATTDNADTSTVLTGNTGDTDTTDKSGTNTNPATDDKSKDGSDATDDKSKDGSDATDDKSKDGSDAGKEGSDTPPDTYADFVMPEGMPLDEAVLSEASPLFKELGLNQEQAQKLIDVYAKQVQAGSTKQIDDFNQLMNDWRDQSKNDGEFGGDKFDENVKVAQSAISKYGTPELKQLLDEHGVGNHPEVIRFMVRVGRTLNEDVPGSIGGTPTKAEDAVSILYPNDS